MANQLRVTLISTELAYIVFAVSMFCSTIYSKGSAFKRTLFYSTAIVFGYSCNVQTGIRGENCDMG